MSLFWSRIRIGNQKSYKSNHSTAMPRIPDLPSVENAHKEKLRTWEVLGTTQKYSWTTRAPPLKYATPLFAQLEPEKKRPIENSPDPRFAKEKVQKIFQFIQFYKI